MTGPRMTRRATSAAVVLLLTATPALAHHPMGGGKVTTAAQGLLSGLGHPVIGLDHLCFLLAIGTVAAFLTGGARVIAAFMAASFAGVVLHLAHVGLPFVEAGIAATVLLAGVLLLTGPARLGGAVLALALVAGVLHGYALAESIVGVEPTPLAAYLVGLTIVQATLTTAAMLIARLALAPQSRATERLRRTGGTAVCLAGLYFLATAPFAG